MPTLNRVVLIGTLTTNVTLRQTAKGLAVCDFTMLMTHQAAKGTGKAENCYVDIQAWGELAELCAEYLKEESKAFVEGYLVQTVAELPDGRTSRKTFVNATEIQFIGSPGKGRPDGGDQE
jgi:single-strand DNA-binding protein